MFWNTNRFVICGIIVLFLALLNVSESIRTYHLGYEISKTERELKVTLENEKGLTQYICNYKLPRNILTRAGALGMEAKSLNSEAIANLHSFREETTGLARGNRNAGRVR